MLKRQHTQSRHKIWKKKIHITFFFLCANYSITIKVSFRRKGPKCLPAVWHIFSSPHCFLPVASPLFSRIILSLLWLGYRNNLGIPHCPSTHWRWNIPAYCFCRSDIISQESVYTHQHVLLETLKVVWSLRGSLTLQWKPLERIQQNAKPFLLLQHKVVWLLLLCQAALIGVTPANNYCVRQGDCVTCIYCR